RKGRLVEVTDPHRLTAQRWRSVTVTFRGAAEGHGLDKVPGVRSVEALAGGGLRLRVEGPVDPLIKALAPLSVEDVQIERPSREEIFLTYYESDADNPKGGQP